MPTSGNDAGRSATLCILGIFFVVGLAIALGMFFGLAFPGLTDWKRATCRIVDFETGSRSESCSRVIVFVSEVNRQATYSISGTPPTTALPVTFYDPSRGCDTAYIGASTTCYYQQSKVDQDSSSSATLSNSQLCVQADRPSWRNDMSTSFGVSFGLG